MERNTKPNCICIQEYGRLKALLLPLGIKESGIDSIVEGKKVFEEGLRAAALQTLVAALQAVGTPEGGGGGEAVAD